MVRRRWLLASLLTGLMLLTLTACSTGKSTTGSTQVVRSTSASSAVTTVATTPTPAPFSPAHTPQWDPVLAGGSWGIISRHKAGVPDENEDETDEKRIFIKQDQVYFVTTKQSSDLLRIFRHSTIVRSLIERNGGEVDDTTFTVRAIAADVDTGVDTAWVNATLRADFPTVDGLKGIEVEVYRQKTSKGLDNHPYVVSTLVGFLAKDDTLESPKRLRFQK